MEIQRKITAGIIGVFISLGLCVGTASAAGILCRGVTIEKVGARSIVNPIDYEVYFKCNANWPTARRMLLSSDLGKTGYATLLTAMSLDKTIDIWVESSAPHSLVTAIEINP